MAVKQTYLYKGGLKPGTYYLEGKNNLAKNGNLRFDRIIGDFLTAKGLATTEDNCSYLLNCCSDFTLSYDGETGELCLTMGEETQCVSIDALIEIQANNALTGDGTSSNKLQWGGNLVKNTTVEGNEDYSVTLQNLTQFLVTVLGSSAGGTLRVSGLQSLPAFLRHRNTTNTEWMTIDLDFNDVSSFGFQNATDLYAFRVFPDTQELAIRTPAIVNGTATVGEVFTLTDDAEGKGEWGPVPGAGISYDDYEDDTAAGAGGIAIGQCYSVTAGNPYGLADGTIRKRRS